MTVIEPTLCPECKMLRDSRMDALECALQDLRKRNRQQVVGQ